MESHLGIFKSEHNSFSLSDELKTAKIVSLHARDICKNIVGIKISVWLLFRVRSFTGIVRSHQIVLAFKNVAKEHMVSYLYQHILSKHFMRNLFPNSQVI